MTDKDKKGMATSFERLPDVHAEQHFGQKSIITSAEFANFKAYQHALAFTVAGLADKDMLTEIHKAVKGAIDNGTSFNDFKKSLRPFLIAKGYLAPALGDDEQVNKELLKSYEKNLNKRLKIIYDTNKATAYAGGQWERLQRTKRTFPYLQYCPSLSTNKRDEHKAYYGIVRHIDDPIWQSIFPPNGFGCFLGDVQIQGDLQSAMVKWYEGVAVHFTTKSGRSLAVTANHPILTARGWVRADGLTTSDDVLCYGLPVDVVNADGLSGQIHHNQTIPTAKNLFKAFFDQTFAFTGTTAFKFNSDVANGEIHIDVINDGLVCHIWADVLQGVKQVKLIRGDDGRFVATGKSNSSSCFATVISDFIGSQNTSDIATTAIKMLCQSTLAYFGCGVQMNDFSFQFVITRTTDRPSLSTLPFNTTSRLFNVLPTSHTGTTHISQDDTILTQLASNTCTTDFGLFGYLIDAHSSLVFADPVINIRQFSFSGHCYDFQSSESIVSANGIIAHNCKCYVKPLTADEARKIGISTDDDVANLPVPDFDSNFDRLGSLLRLAEDKHGKEFREKLEKGVESILRKITTSQRNDLPLTDQQKDDVIKVVGKYDIDLGAVKFVENNNTAFVSMYGMELLQIGLDVYPTNNPHIYKNANSTLSMSATIAHELAGHRDAQLADKTHSDDLLEEVQASIRASMYGIDLTDEERQMLYQDALDRLAKNGVQLNDIKHTLWLEPFRGTK